MMKRVLLLDDDRDLCFVMRQMIEHLGVSECITANSVAELQCLESDALHSDLALLDVNLGPDSPSGLEAYSWLKAHRYSGKVVFFTGHARSHPAIQEAMRLPGVALLEKPVAMDRLEALLK